MFADLKPVLHGILRKNYHTLVFGKHACISREFFIRNEMVKHAFRWKNVLQKIVTKLQVEALLKVYCSNIVNGEAHCIF